MHKGTQFISAAVVGVFGIIFMSISRFSASADQLIPSSTMFVAIMILGLILMLAAALWFYYLSTRE